MSEELATPAVVGRFPASKGRSRAWQARGHAKHVQLAVEIEARQVVRVPFQGFSEGPVEKPHLPQIKRLRNAGISRHRCGRSRQRRSDAQDSKSQQGCGQAVTHNAFLP